MMGRRTGPPPINKATGPKQGKQGEVSKGPKRQQKKPVATTMSSVVKKKPVKSKQGFTLYSGRSRVDGEQKIAHSGGEVDQMTEIVSQVQLQEERAKSSQAASLYIPTADAEVSQPGGETEDFLVSTPFNKRLVSSTPDPERIKEVELEHLDLQPEPGPAVTETLFDNSPQMIPERDVTTLNPGMPRNTTELAASVARGLSEKLRLQREAAQSSKPSHPGEPSHETVAHLRPDTNSLIEPLSSAGQTKVVPPWKQKHQKWRQELQPDKTDLLMDQAEGNELRVLNAMLVSEKAVELSSQHPTPKAEWVCDSVPSHIVNKGSLKPSVNQGRENIQKKIGFVQGRTDVTASIGDSGINSSVEPSTPAISTVKTNISFPGIGSTSFSRLPTSLSSFSSTQAARPVQDHYKNYQSLKSGILQNRTNSGSRILPQENAALLYTPPVNITQMMRLHPGSAPTITAQSHGATVTSNLSHTSSTVTSSSSSIKVCEAVTGPLTLLHGSLPQRATPSQSGPLHGVATITTAQASAVVPEKEFNSHHSYGKSQEMRSSDAMVPTTSIQTVDSGVISIPTVKSLDSTVDSQESELSKILGSSAAVETPQNGCGKAEGSQSPHNTSYLSEVINFLRTDGFNAKQKPNTAGSEGKSDNCETSGHIVEAQQTNEVASSNSADDNLREMMSKYLPGADQEVPGTTNKSIEQVPDSPKDAENGGAQQDINNSSCTPQEKADSNQNYNSDDSYDRPPRRRKRSHNLYYLESLADPTLKEIACRLAFKATALRDVELRDLIDDMIFHTDAALGHEDARYQSSHLFLQEENSKLKKRLHNVNRQLDAKERQEKMAATSVYSVSNNEMLHLERKLMHARQEKDRLDSQLTALLEEKSRWLLTQQDLVKTISLRDHEILKLEEKHQQERMKLHQSLDQATQNSQGVHYKLSVADREISNMEQRLKCRDLDIADLREKLRLAELGTGDCQQQLSARDQEVARLKDTVDTLKLGVDHVLQMFEASPTSVAATDQQRQGIETLHRMAHPERFSSNPAVGGREPPPVYQQFQPQVEPEPAWQRSFSTSFTNQAPTLSTQNSDHMAYPQPIRPQPRYPEESLKPTPDTSSTGREPERRQKKHLSWMQQRLQNLTQRQEQAGGRAKDADFESRLTEATLEQHNQRLSPINRRLWRSMHDSPVELAAEPYYSDSEVELNQRDTQQLRKSLKSILKLNRRAQENCGGGQGHALTTTPTGEEYYGDQSREESDRQERRVRMRRKSESDIYTDQRRSSRDSPRSYKDRRPGVKSAKSREGRHERSRSREEDSEDERDGSRSYKDRRPRMRPATSREGPSERSKSREEDPEDEGDGSRYSIADFFKRKSQMPPLSKSPERREQSSSQSSRLSTLYSVPISQSSDSWGHRGNERSTSAPRSRSRSRSHDEELVEIDIKSGSIDSSDVDYHQDRSVIPQHQLRESHRAWNTARSYSPSSMRKTCHSRSRQRRSRSAEDFLPDWRNPETDTYATTSSQEQQTIFRTLEPETDSSGHYDSPHRRRDGSTIYFSPRKAPWPSHPGRELEPQSSSALSQHHASSGHSSGGITNGFRSHHATRGSEYPNQSSPRHTSDISLTRRATKAGDITQREFFEGTELSNTSLSSIEDDENNAALTESKNDNRMRSLNEDLFSTGIASLDMKIANLQKKIDRAKAIFS